jgi:class 3 adenylate cyclase/tetratricopeptide (TPR) repeat protein
VTLLFSDLCNYVGLGEISDPEETESFRRRLEQMAAGLVAKHGGVISQCYGDGILAVFGLPFAQEDDCRRAVEAALEIHAAARAMHYGGETVPDFEVRMHSGVHAGLVFVRAGDSLHGTYDITGDAVSTASRLSAVAGRDEVLVSATTLQGVEAFFALEPALELSLKGKRSPLLVSRVRERSAVRTRFEARLQEGLTPLAGRTDELDLLISALQQSRAERGRVGLLTGPAGIGKTRLLEELRRRAAAAGALVMSGSCDSYGEASPLEPFLQMWRQLFGIQLSTPSNDAVSFVQHKLGAWDMTDYVSTVLQLLSLGRGAMDAKPLDMTGPAPASALLALVDAQVRQGPVLLLLDDWQWADELSQKLLSRVVPHLQERGVLLIVGMRNDAVTQTFSLADFTLQLEPLSSDEARQVVAVLREQDLDLGLTAALHERSGGNPLYLEELCRSVSDDAMLSIHALEQGAIPNTLQGLIQARAAKLEPSQMSTLQRASIIGMEFTSTMLAADDTREKIDEDLAQLVNAGLVYPTSSAGIYRFKHGITREVIYSSVLINDRRRIHHEIATTLERSVASNQLIDQSTALAFHYRGSGDHERAALHAERAGDKAAGSSFLKSARNHYEASLESLDRLTTTLEIKRTWLRVSGKWAAQCAYAPTRAQLKTLERAEAYACELHDEQARAHNRHMLGWFHYVFGDYADSIGHCETALELAQSAADSKLHVQLLTALGQAYSVSGDYERALVLLNQGIEQKRARASIAPPAMQQAAQVQAPARRAPPVLYAHSLTCRAMIYADLGDFAKADRDIAEALQIVDGIGHAMEPSVLSHQAIIQIRRGAWAECIATSSRACKIAERVNSTFVFGLCSAFENYSLWRLNASADALRRLKRATDWLDARDFGLYISFIYGCLGEALCESEQLELAQSYAQRALKRALQDDPQGEIAANRVLSQLSRRRGDPWQVSEQHLSRALEACRTRGARRDLALTSLCGAELALSPGEEGSLTALYGHGMLSLEQTIVALEEMDMPWYRERALRLVP